MTGHAIAASGATAQSTVQRPALRTLYDVKEGAQVRVTTLTRPPERFKGRLLSLRENTLTVSAGGSTREFLLPSVLRVDESYRDRKRGALAGLIAAGVLVYARDFFGPPYKYIDQSKRYRENALLFVAGGGAGALIGGSIGWKRWRPIPTVFR